MKTAIEMAKEAGFREPDEVFVTWDATEAQIERFAALVNTEKHKEVAKLYEMAARQAKTIKEYQERQTPVNDEIIAELWHKAGGHLHRFARLLEQFMGAVDARR